MSAQFTPGPWTVRYPFVQAEGLGERAGRIADVSIAFKDTATFEANARLIAAAPDMHDVLLSCRDWLIDAAEGKSFFSQAPIKIRELAQADLARLDAALAKARGES